MRALLIALSLLALQGNFERVREVEAKPEIFRFQRDVRLPANAGGQACAVLDRSRL